jgi:hypothetical protein
MNKALLKQLERRAIPAAAGDPLLIQTFGPLECFEGGDKHLYRGADEIEADFVARAQAWARRHRFIVLVGRPLVVEA